MVLNQFKGFLVPAPVSAPVVLSLSPHCSEEEEVAGREKHTVGVRVCRSSRHLGGGAHMFGLEEPFLATC